MAYYMVSVNGAEEKAVEASSQSSARNWAVKNACKVRVMKPEDFLAVGKAGGVIPKATDEPEPEPAAEPSKNDDNASTEDNQQKLEEPPVTRPSGRAKVENPEA